jgi:hypothetical protein
MFVFIFIVTHAILLIRGTRIRGRGGRVAGEPIRKKEEARPCFRAVTPAKSTSLRAGCCGRK